MAWMYCLLMAVPPLCGWSTYGPEGFLTSCSWDYLTRSTNNRSYYIYLLTLGFILPVTVIAYCYTFILAAIYAHSREMRGVKATDSCIKLQTSSQSMLCVGTGFYLPPSLRHYASYNTPYTTQTYNNLTLLTTQYKNTSTSYRITASSIARLRRKASKKSTGTTELGRHPEIIIKLVTLILISHGNTPYAVITFIGQFGDSQAYHAYVKVASLPAFFATASVVYNPIVYGISHPHFRSSVNQYLSTCRAESNSSTPYATWRSKNTHPPVKRVTSNPAVVHHHHIHHVHLRCFPHKHTGHAHFHSEPDPRGVTVIVEQK
ncbi:hypothetical protein L9F63_023111, partial [Diploptera punctata]